MTQNDDLFHEFDGPDEHHHHHQVALLFFHFFTSIAAMTTRPMLTKSTPTTKKRVIVLVSFWAIVQLYLHYSTLSTLNNNHDIEIPSAPEHPPESHHEFPRILHFMWPNKDFDFGRRDKDPHGIEQERTLALVRRIQSNNPKWTIKIWTDEDCHLFMKQYYPQHYQDWISLKPQLKMWDAVRPCILSIYGGIYLDHDIDCDVGVSFDDWISTNTTLLLRKPTHDKRKLGNHFMGSVPHHPLWQIYLDNIWKDTLKNYSVVRHTGPLQLYPTFQEYLAGLDKNNNSNDIRLLSLQEFENPGECERVVGNASYCTAKPHCVHMHTVSPAELNGEDDNAFLQISQYEARLQATTMNYTKVPWACQRFNDFITKSSNDKRPVVFVHIPKTAGTSIESAMGFQHSCHASARDYMECNPQQFEQAFKFATLRNPVERIVSLYYYAKKGGNGGIKDAEKFAWVKKLDLTAFVKALPSRHEINFAPQSYFVLNERKELMVDEILCTERLSQDWKQLQAQYTNVAKFGDLPAKRLRSVVRNVLIPVGSDIVRRLRYLYPRDFWLWEQHCGNSSTREFERLVQ